MKSLRSWLAVTFFLFVISILISQSAMDGFGTLSCLLLIVVWWKEKRSFPLFSKTSLELPFLLFSLAVFLSFLTNWQNETLFLSRAIELKWILHFYLIVTILKTIRPSWKNLQGVQVLIAISAVFALLAPMLGYDLLQGPAAEIDRTSTGVARVGGFFSNPMTFSHLHALFLFLLVGMSLKFIEDRDQRRFSTVALTLILGLAVFLSFTRGVWIGAFAGLAVTGFVFCWRWGIAILLGSVLLAVAGIYFVPSIQDRALQVFSSTSYDSERMWIWKANLEVFKDHPIFGIGYGQNTLALKDYYQKVGAPSGLIESHAHNQYLHVSAGLGLFGFVAYLWMIFKFLSETCKTYFWARSEKLEPWIQGLLLGSIGAQVSFMVGSLTESNFEHSKVRYALMVVWAIPFWIKSLLPRDVKKFSSEIVPKES